MASTGRGVAGDCALCDPAAAAVSGSGIGHLNGAAALVVNTACLDVPCSPARPAQNRNLLPYHCRAVKELLALDTPCLVV